MLIASSILCRRCIVCCDPHFSPQCIFQAVAPKTQSFPSLRNRLWSQRSYPAHAGALKNEVKNYCVKHPLSSTKSHCLPSAQAAVCGNQSQSRCSCPAHAAACYSDDRVKQNYCKFLVQCERKDLCKVQHNFTFKAYYAFQWYKNIIKFSIKL